jgi:hypothetical protein
MVHLPAVSRPDCCGEYLIHLAFINGVEEAGNFEPWLGPVFDPLKDPEHFRRLFVEGGTATWPNGTDIAPETLYERAKPSAAT